MSLGYSYGNQDAPQKPKSITYHDTDAYVRNVVFVPLDGTKLFLNYGDLVFGLFAPQENRIILTFRTHNIVLEGHNLSDLFDSLIAHTLRQIIAVDKRYTATEEESAIIVTQILMKPLISNS